MPAPKSCRCLRCRRPAQPKKAKLDGLCAKCRQAVSIRSINPRQGHERHLAPEARIAGLAAKAAREEPLFSGPRPR